MADAEATGDLDALLLHQVNGLGDQIGGHPMATLCGLGAKLLRQTSVSAVSRSCWSSFIGTPNTGLRLWSRCGYSPKNTTDRVRRPMVSAGRRICCLDLTTAN